MVTPVLANYPEFVQTAPQSDVSGSAPEKVWQTGEAAAIVILGCLGGFLSTGVVAFLILSHPALRISLHEEGIYGIPVAAGLCGMILLPLPLLVRHLRGSLLAPMLRSISWACTDRVFLVSAALGLIAGFAYSAVKSRITGREFATFGSAYVAVFAITTVAAALVEEIYFRGIFYEALRLKIGVFWSISAVTLAFCLIHPKNLFGVFPIAMVLGAVRVYTNSTKASFATHAAYNVALAVMMMPFHLRW